MYFSGLGMTLEDKCFAIYFWMIGRLCVPNIYLDESALIEFQNAFYNRIVFKGQRLA